MTFTKSMGLKKVAAALALIGASIAGAQAAVTITILNTNAAGVGFNDTTPAAPVGGNTGVTLGEQRLIAFTEAANMWGATLTSSVPIIINATFEPLTCTATSATLGSAGATSVFVDFPNAPIAGSLYSGALANKLSGEDQNEGAPQIRARFNSNLGLNATCLPGSPFYLGLDNNHGNLIDFMTVLLHEMGHGLGFQTFTNGQTGAQLAGYPSVWDNYLLDNRTSKLRINMTDAERASSGISNGALVWTGAHVQAAVPNVLSPISNLVISGPASGAAAGNHDVGDASFGPALSSVAVTGQLMPVVDQANGTGLACNPLSAVNALAVRNNIGLVDRGTCTFSIKVKNLQNAGAIGVLVADNVVAALSGLGGTDPTITIPSVRITMNDGIALRAQMTHRSRTASGVIASLGLNPTKLAGTDNAGRMELYTPSPYQPGSSVSHYTTDAKRNQLMEPAINGDLLHTVLTPYDMTFELLKDIGW